MQINNFKHKRLLLTLIILAPSLTIASEKSHHIEDAIANVIAIFAIIFAPILLIGIFWILHILPEIQAEKKQHPQKEAIKAICIASLFFGGLLWPIAWIWAHTKPVSYKLAYGRDKHDDYYKNLNLSEKKSLEAQISSLQHQLNQLEISEKQKQEMN